MKGLRMHLAPFTPDISGAAAVLYALGGIVVISDAGGCTGNVCGFDEPRWFSRRSAVFSAGLRDIDAILGRDDRFIDKIKSAAARIDAAFVAVVGTPVPAVIATDCRALRRMAEVRIGLPALAIDTTGMALYDEGQEKAYDALFDTFAKERRGGGEPFVCVLGATPLDLPAPDSACHIRDALERESGVRAVVCGEEGSLPFVGCAGEALRNVVVSPSGLKSARKLREKFGTPYETFYPMDMFEARKFCEARRGKRILIVHQQVLACALRDELEKCGGCGRISTASWFRMDGELMRDGDVKLCEEDDLLRCAEAGGFDVVVGDPLFARALRGWHGDFVPLPHFAVSGCLHAAGKEEDFWHGLCAEV